MMKSREPRGGVSFNVRTDRCSVTWAGGPWRPHSGNAAKRTPLGTTALSTCCRSGHLTLSLEHKEGSLPVVTKDPGPWIHPHLGSSALEFPGRGQHPKATAERWR